MSQTVRADANPESIPNTPNLRSLDRKSLSRAITIVENDLEGHRDIKDAINNNLGNAHVIGITGPPGVGKSTLIDACIPAIRKSGHSVAVLAVDPSSHISGGAILGDRVRMAQHGQDDGVFIRSVAARGHLGGLSATALNIINLFDATGWNTIIVETVGTGQSETEISELADTAIVVESPGLGDEVQAIKAGLLEIADIIVVNKADQSQSDLTVSELRSALSLRHSPKSPQVLKTVATSGEGIEELVQHIQEHGTNLGESAYKNRRFEKIQTIVARNLGEAITREFNDCDNPALSNLALRISTGEADIEQFVRSFKEYVEQTLEQLDD